ncbi:MAG: DUF3099 domain-containing protein [Streptosporangiales bacterium]|jgi:hypothetical protein|nr:DUF3099 domain-containing protein [Streptosporangiales bacterium]
MAADQDPHDPDRDGPDPDERDLRMWDRELGGYGGWHHGPPESQPQPGPQPSPRTKKVYFIMMGVCLGLFVLAWAVVDRYSTIAAVAMCAVALVIPPVAAIIVNAASSTDRRR